MPNKLLAKFIPKRFQKSYLRNLVTGSLYKISDLRGDTSLADIKTQIDTMRALARDSQISTALSYYATDSTLPNTDGNIIWATPINKKHADVAEVVNELFKRWNVNSYVRDHILELATIGNLYIPTTNVYKPDAKFNSSEGVALDNNTIPDPEYDILPAYKIPPENVVHLWLQGQPQGYMFQPEDGIKQYVLHPESSVIHFSLGGLLGDYTIDTKASNGDVLTYDIKFAQPLMEKAVQPTQTLSLLEDSIVLSSLTRVVRFIHVECGNGADDDEVRNALQQIKDAIEQQLSINTSTGDIQSFVNPQSPNNLIYLPKINGQEALTTTDMNMAETNDTDSKLLQYYQDKKLSVLGVPKEAMNFSSNEGLGGAGAVLSQRSALYANSLQRLVTAYVSGWTDAINKYFEARNMSGFIGKFKLNMQPIITEMSTVVSERRDAAIAQATEIVALMKELGVTKNENYLKALSEALKEVFPQISGDMLSWIINVEEGSEGGDLGEL